MANQKLVQQFSANQKLYKQNFSTWNHFILNLYLGINGQRLYLRYKYFGENTFILELSSPLKRRILNSYLFPVLPKTYPLPIFANRLLLVRVRYIHLYRTFSHFNIHIQYFKTVIYEQCFNLFN